MNEQQLNLSHVGSLNDHPLSYEIIGDDVKYAAYLDLEKKPLSFAQYWVTDSKGKAIKKTVLVFGENENMQGDALTPDIERMLGKKERLVEAGGAIAYFEYQDVAMNIQDAKTSYPCPVIALWCDGEKLEEIK